MVMSNKAVRPSRVEFAQGLVKGRLHEAVGGKRCGCRQCAYWVTVAAGRAGISREQLESVLAPVAAADWSHARARAQLRARIGDTATVSVRGRDVEASAGLAVLLARFHDS